MNEEQNIESVATEPNESAAPEQSESESIQPLENPAETFESSKPTKRLKPIITACIIALSLLVAAFATVMGRTLFPFKSELGQPFELGFMGKLPQFVFNPGDSLAGVDTNKLGEYPINARLFGFIQAELTAEIVDTTPPTLTLSQLRIMPEYDRLVPEDFVEACDDLTDVSFKFKADPTLTLQSQAAPESRQITVIATDTSGNSVEAQTDYTLDPSLVGLCVELGTPRADIERFITERTGGSKLSELDTASDIEAIGRYNVRNNNTLLTFEVVDTIAPRAVAVNHDFLIGTDFTDEDLSRFAAELYDESEVTLSLKSPIDNKRVGTQTISLILTDSAGNTSEIEAKLRLHDIPASYTFEAGKSTDAVMAELLQNNTGAAPTLVDSFAIDYLQLGTSEILLHGDYSDFAIKVTKQDTTAPRITLRDLETNEGVMPNASDFLEYCDDATSVTCEFVTTPDVNTRGYSTVTIKVTDQAGNSTVASAGLTVVTDTTPPVIYGARDLYAYEGDTIAFRSGVYAEDDSDGRVTVYVNSTRVNTKVAGWYKVTYTATDSHGNTATKTINIEIRKVNAATINELADGILSQIITWSMNDYEKALAIYNWCVENIRYSTATSDLMDQYYKAAYSGYKKHYGNCYTYYAVARSLLTRAGFENMQIRRNSYTRPHYWNLVKVDGYWYHFDTCPQPSPNNVGCFLLTDAEVAEYSSTREIGYYSFAANTYPSTP